MTSPSRLPIVVAVLSAAQLACSPAPVVTTAAPAQASAAGDPIPSAAERLARYTPFRLVADTGRLTASERRMIPLLVAAAREMHPIFWEQAYGNGDSLLGSIAGPAARRLAEVNVGPWDRLDDNAPFVAGIGPKPDGANFYPAGATRE